jgi:hypothetical protein
LEDALAQARQQLVEDPTHLSAAQQMLLYQDKGTRAGGGGAAYSQAAGQAQENARALAERQAGRLDVLGTEQASAAQDLAARQEDIAAQLQANARERQSQQEAHAKELDKLSAQMVEDRNRYLQAADSVDPARLTRGKEWLVAMSMSLGAFGASFGNGHNYAQETLNQAIDRDLEAQKGGVAARKEAASITQQIYAQKQAQFSNQEAAKLATRADVLDIGAHLMGARAQKVKGTEAAALQSSAADEIRKQAELARAQALQLQAKALATQQPLSSLEQRAKASELTSKIAAAQKGLNEANTPGGSRSAFANHVEVSRLQKANPNLRFDPVLLQEAVDTRTLTKDVEHDIEDANYALEIRDRLIKAKSQYDQLVGSNPLMMVSPKARTLARTYAVHREEFATAAAGRGAAMQDKAHFRDLVPDINNTNGLDELKTSVASGVAARYKAKLGTLGTTIPSMEESSEPSGLREPTENE